MVGGCHWAFANGWVARRRCIGRDAWHAAADCCHCGSVGADDCLGLVRYAEIIGWQDAFLFPTGKRRKEQHDQARYLLLRHMGVDRCLSYLGAVEAAFVLAEPQELVGQVQGRSSGGECSVYQCSVTVPREAIQELAVHR